MGLMQATVTPLPTGLSLKGKTFIVTGATAGMGLETARQLVVLQADTVILAARNLEKAKGVKQQLLADPQVKKHHPNANVQVLQLDMDDYGSIAEFVRQVQEPEMPAVDALVLNAGLGYMPKMERSTSGHERTTQVNYLSNALLILALLPHLRESARKRGSPARITWVGSRTHYETTLLKKPVPEGTPILAAFDDPGRYDFIKRYHDTKLLCAAFFYDLAARVPRDEVLLNMMCPGMIATDMSDRLPQPLRMVASVLKAVRARPIEQAGWMLVHSAAVSGPESHGQFILDKEPAP